MHLTSQLRKAFTLFEVMISMMVLVFAILATISILPIGLRAQQLARSQMFAASLATTMINQFHHPIATFKGISSLVPDYNGVPGTDTTDPTKPPFHGWAGQLRNASVHASAYQYNAEQVLTGWFSGVLPIPIPIARRLDSDNDEIGKLLDQGALLYYPDPNFMQGFNQGAAQDVASQVSPDPELQKLVFAFTGLPQQNALSSHPVESLPWYESYPFPPEWISLQATGGESRLVGFIPWDTSTGYTYAGHRSGITEPGRDTDDWSVGSGVMQFSDAGHAQYHPVTFSVPFRQGQEWMNWYKDRPLDDPDSSDEYLKQDPGTVGFYQGNGFYHGRNWRYFAKNNGGLWLTGNSLPSTDPLYLVHGSDWAYTCFQRLSGADDLYMGYPRRAYANVDQQDNSIIPAYSVSSITQDDSTNAVVNSVTGVSPTLSFPAHPPATYYRAGWLPVRAMLTNPDQVCYEGMMGAPYQDPNPAKNWDPGQPGPPASPVPDTYAYDNGSPWTPPSWPGNQGIQGGSWNSHPANTAEYRAWNLLSMCGIPQTSQPMATYEMRANYRDRAIDLWQAVMPTHSNLAVMLKNTLDTSGGSEGLVRESEGGTLVDCPKYEYAPAELDRFVMLSPQGLGPGDTPIHPAQILALSYLAHAAMMVTGYGPPFGRIINQVGNPIADTIRMSWEGLNWTYMPTNSERAANGAAAAGTGLPYPEVSPPPQTTSEQGIYKDTLFVTQNYAAGSTQITICNNTVYPWAIYPGDEIVLEPSYYQWYYRYGIPWHGDGQIWDQADPHKDNLGKYYTPNLYSPPGNLPYPNLNYKLQTFRVTAVQIGAGAPYSLPAQLSAKPWDTKASASAPATAAGTYDSQAVPPAIVPTQNAIFQAAPLPFVGTYVTITISPALPMYPKDRTDAQANPMSPPTAGGQGWDPYPLHMGDKIRRVASPSDYAFARKVSEMCVEWAAAYGAENPNDAGAPRLATHEIMMDKPLALFDLFYDAANSSTSGNAVRFPLNFHVSDGTPPGVVASQKESFYRWMVPSNPVPSTWFHSGAPPSLGQHANSNLGPAWARNSYFDQMVQNSELNPPSVDNDDKHFWLTKPFGAFTRCRAIKFWSVDWKSYADAETAPSAPVDFAKHNRYPRFDSTLNNYSGIAPHIEYGQAAQDRGDGHSVLCGLPESLYAWVSPTRTTRYGDVMGGEYAGYLYQNWTSPWTTPARQNLDPPPSDGQQVTADVHLGHWGADRNGNGRLDIGPVSISTRMHALNVGEYLYYDPVIRLNAGN
jgi:hypothetical protein